MRTLRFKLHDAPLNPSVIVAQVTYEYPGFILSYEATNLNAHGTGGRTPGKAYYQARGQDDHPHGEASKLLRRQARKPWDLI